MPVCLLPVLWTAHLRAFLTTSETVLGVMPLSLQYVDLIQSDNLLVPLLELHATQQRAMFSVVMIFASLTMCSHVACDLLVSLEESKRTPQ